MASFLANLVREKNFLTNHLNKYTKDLGVGIILKGIGTVPPSSKYDIHSFVRANFHSVSACSYIRPRRRDNTHREKVNKMKERDAHTHTHTHTHINTHMERETERN